MPPLPGPNGPLFPIYFHPIAFRFFIYLVNPNKEAVAAIPTAANVNVSLRVNVTSATVRTDFLMTLGSNFHLKTMMNYQGNLFLPLARYPVQC